MEQQNVKRKDFENVFFKIQIGNEEPETIKIQLNFGVAPKTCENFYQLAVSGKYNKTPFHRIIPGFMMQGGDFENQNGTGGKSIYGNKFNDENFKLSHSEKYVLSMANAGPNTNGSQFFITFDKCSWLNGKHVVFGKVTEGMRFLDKIERLGSPNGTPSKKVLIVECYAE